MQGIFRFLCADAGVFTDLDNLLCSGLSVTSRQQYRQFMLQRLVLGAKGWRVLPGFEVLPLDDPLSDALLGQHRRLSIPVNLKLEFCG